MHPHGALGTSDPGDDRHKDHHHDLHKALEIGLPFLGASLLTPFAAKAGMCAVDPILCNLDTLKYLRYFFKGAAKLLPSGNWFRSLFDEDSQKGWKDRTSADPDEASEERPPYPQAKIPLPPKQKGPGKWRALLKGTPVEEGQLFRGERYDPETGRAEQQTLKLIKADDDETWSPFMDPENFLGPKGMKPYQMLDSDGDVIHHIRKHKQLKDQKPVQHIVWHRPEDLEPMEGE